MPRKYAREGRRKGPRAPLLLAMIVFIAAIVGTAAWMVQHRAADDRDANQAAPASAARVTGAESYPDEVTVAEAAARREAGAFVLDVRQPEEWAEVHIPGATLVPLGDLPSRLRELPRNKDIVVVCRSGNRSAQGRDILRQAGFTATTSMAGGMNEWSAAGLPTTTGP